MRLFELNMNAQLYVFATDIGFIEQFFYLYSVYSKIKKKFYEKKIDY